MYLYCSSITIGTSTSTSTLKNANLHLQNGNRLNRQSYQVMTHYLQPSKIINLVYLEE